MYERNAQGTYTYTVYSYVVCTGQHYPYMAYDEGIHYTVQYQLKTTLDTLYTIYNSLLRRVTNYLYTSTFSATLELNY